MVQCRTQKLGKWVNAYVLKIFQPSGDVLIRPDVPRDGSKKSDSLLKVRAITRYFKIYIPNSKLSIAIVI